MSREFSFKRFEAGKPLLEQLTAERLNAMLDAISRNRPEFGDNVTGQRTPGGTIIRANAKAIGGDNSRFPFKATITTDTAVPPNVVIAIEPGRVSTIVPTRSGTLLTDDPPPFIQQPDDDMSLFLRIHIDTTNVDNNKRAGIDAVTVVTDNEVGEDLTGPELEEYKMFWEDEGTELGHFYVKIADIDIAGDPPVMTVDAQWLRSNIETIVISGDEAIVLATDP